MALERKGPLLPLGGLRHVWLVTTALARGCHRPCRPAGTGVRCKVSKSRSGVGGEPALALCSAKGSRTSFLVLSASGETTARRFQGPHRSNGGAVSAECSVRLRHRPTPFKRMCVYGSNAALREARCSGQLWLRNKPPPIRSPKTASVHCFSRFCGLAWRPL